MIPCPPTLYSPSNPPKSRGRWRSFRVGPPTPYAAILCVPSLAFTFAHLAFARSSTHARLSVAKVKEAELNIQCLNPSCAARGSSTEGATATAPTAATARELFLSDETVLAILEMEPELQERYRTSKAELEYARAASARRRAYGPFAGLREAREDRQTRSWAAENWQKARKCPGCDCWIEKNDGCSHMTCRQVS